ncbi:MAG: tetratricopeptide repeat protein [Gemmatimonadota bacterium]
MKNDRTSATAHAAALLAVLLLAGPAPAQSPAQPDVDTIVDRHIEARGGIEAIRAIRTLVYSKGQYREGDFVGGGNSRMAFRRPYYRVVGDPSNASGFLEGYDGGSWEWYGNPGIAIRTVGAASGATRRGADFEGRLIDYRAKGSTVVLGPVAEVEGRPAYRLTLTTLDGFRRDYFIDRESYLIVAERYAAPVHAFGAAVATEARMEDYREVAGVLFPHRFRESEIQTGRTLNQMQWGRIEANVELPLSHFSPPDPERTPLQKVLEAIFAGRTDPDAVLWSYREFRRGYPEVDRRAGVEMIGFQILKMGDGVDAAIRLLEVNARDYPLSASAAFSLARALETAGYPHTAAAEYRRAVELDPEHEAARRALARLGGGGRGGR